MKKFLLLFVASLFSIMCMAHSDENFQESDMLKSMQPGDKAAVLMVHFGTSYDDTRALTIDAINNRVKEEFQNLRVEEAYTSRMIVRILDKRGVKKDLPVDALLKLKAEGYTHVIVQSTNVIEGAEMESLRIDVAKVAPFFKDIRIGAPLLSSVWDCHSVAKIITGMYAGQEKPKGGRQHYILVGHGTYTSSTATYSQIDYILKATGYDNFHVATLEGYPTYETAMAQFENEKKVKGVTLVPFMFVAGDHAQNDIAGEWKEQVESDGYAATAVMKGLGEIPQIQEIYIDHIKFALHHKVIGIMAKKAHYDKEVL